MTRRAGLGHDPLATPRLASVIPTTPATEDDPEPTDTPPAAPEATKPSRRTTKAAPAATEGTGTPGRRTDSIARTGPMSLGAGAPKRSYSFYVDPDLLEEARDAVVHLGADPDGPRTLSALIEEGLRRELVRLQDELNDQQPFPHRRVALRRGFNTRDM